MSDPIGSFSGLASGIQWRDMLDQIVAVDKQRRLDPVTKAQDLAQKRLDAWSTYSSLVSKFRDAAKALRDGSAFSVFTVTGGTSSTTGRTLLTAAASSSAAPGTFDVEVLDLARANKVSGAVQSSATAALGIAGEFAVNGKNVTIIATDSLSTIRDKVNALNAGASPTGVTASVLSTGSTQHRLVLTSDVTGAGGVELVDDSAGTLQTLGLVDNTRTLNVDASGGAQTYRVSSSTAAIATMLGVTLPSPSTITIGGRTISVDLSVDSLSTIAAKILAAGGSASVTSETVNGKTSYRLVTSDTVGATTVDGQRTLDVLGFMKSGRSGVAQVVTSDNTYSDAAGATATASTLLTDLKVNGNPLGVAAGDTFTLQGLRGDGSTVNLSFVVGSGDTLQTVLDKLNDGTTGYGSGTRTATASLSGGQILLTDGTAGDSQLSLAMSVTPVAGGTINLGRMSTTTVGRLRDVVAGADARIKVDGVVVRRASNTINDALAGVTLNLQQAEAGSTSTIVINRDVDGITKTVSNLALAYNELLKFKDGQGKADQPLHNDPSLRSGFGTITSTLLAPVVGVSGTYTTGGLVGLSLQRDGTLSLDSDAFKAALSTSFADVQSLFSTGGTATNGNVSYWTSTEKSVPGTYAIDITALATTPGISSAGFSGTYSDDGTPDTMTVTDSISGYSGSVSLANGDTIDTIVDKLNAMFASSRQAITATKNGNELVLAGSNFGTAAKITVAYTGGGTDSTAQLGLAAGAYSGTDVAGTIGGLPATGNGQLLTGASGGVTDGLSVRYTGAATGAMGSISFVLGLSGGLYRSADELAKLGGSITAQTDALTLRINQLQMRADTVQQALDRRRDSLTRQFVAMEAALSRIQQQGATLTNFINSLNAQKSS